MTLLGDRSRQAERLDADDVTGAALSRSLGFVTEVNRKLGTVRSLRRHLSGLRGRQGVRLLDVGTGNAGVLHDLLAWGQRGGGVGWTGVGLDVKEAVLRVAADDAPIARGQLRLVLGDARALPFADGTFDAAVSTLTLHHFSDADAVVFVAEMARVARRVVVSDLERSVSAYVGARLLAETRWRADPVTRNDGPLSVRRSFTVAELRAIGRHARLDRAQVTRHFPCRLCLVGGSS
jgi:SAM-dependent methyltransferase